MRRRRKRELPESMRSSKKALEFLKGEVEGEFTARDREFVAIMLRHNQNLERTASDMGISYQTARNRLKDPGVAKLLGGIYADFNELAKYSLPKVFSQLVTNATFDPRPLIKASREGPEAFDAALDALTPEQASAIQDWTFRDGVPVMKMANRVQSLDLVMRFFDQQRQQVQTPAREALGISVILRAPDGSTTEVKALATPEQPRVDVDAPA